MLLARNPGGIQIASFNCNANTYENIESSQSWDDYTEHDASRECVEIFRMMFTATAVAGKQVLSTLSGVKRLVFGFRPGTNKVNTPGSVVSSDDFRKMLLFPCNAVIQAAALYAQNTALSVDVAFWESPLIADPVTNVYMAMIEQDSATVFADEDIQVRVWYKWVKANQANQAAYLGWEALGV